VVDYVLESARWWLQEMDVDGFRLDVPNEVPFWVWRIFRQEVHRIEPEAYLVGEIWSDAGDWVSPTCFDAAMNYKYFKDPVTDFIGKGRIDAARFDSALEAGRLAYPTQATQVMMNLVDSHDTPRYLTATGGDVRRLHLTALFQMTYVGAPHIYYGDEIAMRGEADPDCRRPFDWKWAENPDRAPTHQLYRTLAHLRRDHRALTSGEFHTLLAEGPLYAFARRDETETFVVVMNVSDRAAEAVVPVAQLDPSLAAAVFQEAAFADGEIQAAEGVLHVKLAPVSGRIFRLGGSS
jgi:glycosidase